MGQADTTTERRLLPGASSPNPGAVALLSRVVDFKCIPDKRWYGPTLLIMPGAGLLAFGVLRWAGVACGRRTPRQALEPGCPTLLSV